MLCARSDELMTHKLMTPRARSDELMTLNRIEGRQYHVTLCKRCAGWTVEWHVGQIVGFTRVWVAMAAGCHGVQALCSLLAEKQLLLSDLARAGTQQGTEQANVCQGGGDLAQEVINGQQVCPCGAECVRFHDTRPCKLSKLYKY
jgi:hypothetical protein